MDFELTEEQQMVKDMARRFAATEIKPKAAELDEKHDWTKSMHIRPRSSSRWVN
jgi:alkylation response protein AidB-like acyl-CoA dehydrogenase